MPTQTANAYHEHVRNAAYATIVDKTAHLPDLDLPPTQTLDGRQIWILYTNAHFDNNTNVANWHGEKNDMQMEERLHEAVLMQI